MFTMVSTLSNRIDHLLACVNPAEDRMTMIEMGSRKMGDEKLAAIRVRAGIGH